MPAKELTYFGEVVKTPIDNVVNADGTQWTPAYMILNTVEVTISSSGVVSGQTTLSNVSPAPTGSQFNAFAVVSADDGNSYMGTFSCMIGGSTVYLSNSNKTNLVQVGGGADITYATNAEVDALFGGGQP